MSGKKDADPVGICVVGISAGHFYVLKSCSERLDPTAWATRAIEWAGQHHAGRFVGENTGSGGYPAATLQTQTRLMQAQTRPIVESKARGSKADRASPLAAAARGGRLHLVGAGHEQLERELTGWFPGSTAASPGGLDSLVYACDTLSNGWISL